jgi:hypothetical protein
MQKDISKMGQLALQFTNSFEDILLEIRIRTYSDQKQIYTGFSEIISKEQKLAEKAIIIS